VSPHEVTLLLTRKESQLENSDRVYRDQLLQEVKGAKEVHGICESFRSLIETRDSIPSHGWLEIALHSQVHELRSF